MPIPEPENWYSTDLTEAHGFDAHNHEQFVVYFRVLPKQQLMNGKRREAQVQLERISARLTRAMRNLGYTIAESRALEKHQFGHNPAQVVMVGFADTQVGGTEEYRTNKHPVTLRTVDSNGGLRTGIGGNVQHGQNITTEFRTAVLNFKTTVDTMLVADFIDEGIDVSIIKLDYQGVTFGAGGITFPN